MVTHPVIPTYREAIIISLMSLWKRLLSRIHFQFYYLVDGNHLSSSVLQTEDEFMIEDNGELIIGQDQDCLLGCFDEPQALTGDLEDFTIWDTALRSVFKSFSQLSVILNRFFIVKMSVLTWKFFENEKSSDEIAQMYIDGYPSIEVEPKITLATDNCEKHGRIHFVSGNYFATLPLHYPVVILPELPGGTILPVDRFSGDFRYITRFFFPRIIRIFSITHLCRIMSHKNE